MKPNQKLYPHSLEAERAVIGSVLIEPDLVRQIGDTLAPTDFWLESHRKIWESIQSLSMTSTVDLVMLVEALTVAGTLQAVGGVTYLSSITDSIPVTTNALTYARTVAEKARLRESIAMAEAVIDAARTNESMDQLSAQVQAMAKLVQPTRQKLTPVMAEEAAGHLERTWDAQSRSVDGHGISLPWWELEKIIGPLRDGRRPVVIGARPKVGKTFTALGLALCAAEQGKRTLIWELELSRIATVCRLLSIMSGIHYQRIERWSELREDEHGAVADAYARFAQMPILIDATSTQTAESPKYSHAPTVEEMLVRIERVQQRDSQGVDLVICDYGQLVKPNRGQGGRTTRERLVDVADNLQGMASVLGKPVVVMAQVNGKDRETAMREPTSADISETDQFKRMCSACVILDRPYMRLTEEQQRMSTETAHYARAIVDVNESGGLGVASLAIDPRTGAWIDRKGWT